MIALVAVVMASSCMTSSAVYAAVKAKKHMDEKEKDARDARKRARQERAEAGERASKDANEAAEAERAERAGRKEAEAEAERKRKEAEAEANRKRKEAERIEKESSEWATMLNNFMVAIVGKNSQGYSSYSDVAEFVNSGVAGVPEELVPRVLEKLKKRTPIGTWYCPEKDPSKRRLMSEGKSPFRFAFWFGLGDEPISKNEWDEFFTGTDPMLAEAIRGENEPAPPSAFEITKCYEDKTKGLPDFYSLDGCGRNKRFEILRECGGLPPLSCTC